MVVQIRVTKNVKEIQDAEQLLNQAQRENEMRNAYENAHEIELKALPNIPEPIIESSDLLIDVEKVTLAFVNGNGDISIKYEGDNFNLVYSQETWVKLKARFK